MTTTEKKLLTIKKKWWGCEVTVDIGDLFITLDGQGTIRDGYNYAAENKFCRNVNKLAAEFEVPLNFYIEKKRLLCNGCIPLVVHKLYGNEKITIYEVEKRAIKKASNYECGYTAGRICFLWDFSKNPKQTIDAELRYNDVVWGYLRLRFVPEESDWRVVGVFWCQ